MSLSYGQLRWRYFGGCGICIIVVVFLFFGLGALTVAYFLEADQEKWAKEAQTTTGTVLNKGTRQERSGKSRRTVHWVTYSYQGPNGQPLTGEGQLPNEQWQGVQKKQTIPIEYLSSDPTQSRCVTDRSGEGWGPWVVVGFGAVFTLVGLLLGLTSFVRANKQARLIFEGVPVLGTVTEVETVEKWNKGHRRLEYTLHYEFTADNGQHYEGAVPGLSDKLVQRWQEGDAILVAHDLNDPGRHLPDIHDARSEDVERMGGSAGNG